VTSTELGYLTGTTSNIQAQINAIIAGSSVSLSGNNVWTSAGSNTFNGPVTLSGQITGSPLSDFYGAMVKSTSSQSPGLALFKGSNYHGSLYAYTSGTDKLMALTGTGGSLIYGNGTYVGLPAPTTAFNNFELAKNLYQTGQLFTVGGVVTTYYPILIDTSPSWATAGKAYFGINRGSVHMDEPPTGKGGFTSWFEVHSSNWGNGADFLNYNIINSSGWTYERWIAGIQADNRQPYYIVWVRGASSYYFTGIGCNLLNGNPTGSNISISPNYPTYPYNLYTSQTTINNGFDYYSISKNGVNKTYSYGGSLGINGRVPDTAYALDVAGIIRSDSRGLFGYQPNSKSGVFLDNEDAYGNAPCIQAVSSTFGAQTLAINPAGGYVGIGVKTPAWKLTVYGDVSDTVGGVATTTQNANAHGYTAFLLATDTPSAGAIFKNGSTRTADGGVNTMTVRNDGGTLRLMNNFNNSLTITGNGQYVDSAGDYTNSFVVRTSWPSICFNGDNTTGRTWCILNGANGAGIGQGNLGIWDNTAGTYRWAVDKDGRFIFGNPNTLGTQNVSVAKMTMVDAGSGAWNPGTRAYGQGFCITQDNSYSRYTAGLTMSYSGLDYGWINSLAPGVAWKDLTLAGNNVYMCAGGVVGAVGYTWGWQNVSDERCKREINPLKTSRSLERVLNAKPIYYKRAYTEAEDGTPVSDDVKESINIGLSAQDCLNYNPHCVGKWMDTSSKPKDASEDWKGDERYSIDYQNWTIHTIGACQQLHKMIESQKETIETLQNKLTQTETALADYIKLTDERLNKLASLFLSRE
jgi:hypothetical protein